MTPEPQEKQFRGACPLDCPDTCTRIVTVKNGEARSLRGERVASLFGPAF